MSRCSRCRRLLTYCRRGLHRRGCHPGGRPDAVRNVGLHLQGAAVDVGRGGPPERRLRRRELPPTHGKPRPHPCACGSPDLRVQPGPLPRISRAQSMDVLSSQALVSGYRAVLLAAEQLRSSSPLHDRSRHGAAAKVLVLGAGVAGLQAIATARRLVRTSRLRRPDGRAHRGQELGATFVELDLEAQRARAGTHGNSQRTSCAASVNSSARKSPAPTSSSRPRRSPVAKHRCSSPGRWCTRWPWAASSSTLRPRRAATASSVAQERASTKAASRSSG